MWNSRTSSHPPNFSYPPNVAQRPTGEGGNYASPIVGGTFWSEAQPSNRDVRRSNYRSSSPPSATYDDDSRPTEASTAEEAHINHLIATGSIFPNEASSGPSADAPPPYHLQEGAGHMVVEPTEAQGKPNVFIRFGQHTKLALGNSWLNLLLIFVPIGIATQVANLNPGVIFAVNAIAVIPLAGLLGVATETVASSLGDTLGALLNVSFGNAVEFIIFILALVKNELRIVQASLLGSLLANLLLILGMAFFVGGMKYQEQIYNSTISQMSTSLLSLSVMSLLLPAAFHAAFSSIPDADNNTLKISRGTSVVLLFVYILYLLFHLKSHAYMYESTPQQIIDNESQPGVLHVVFDHKHIPSSSETSSVNSETISESRRDFPTEELPRFTPRSPFVVAFPSESNQIAQGGTEFAAESSPTIIMPTGSSNDVFTSDTTPRHHRVRSLLRETSRRSTVAGTNTLNPTNPTVSQPVDSSNVASGVKTITGQSLKMSRTAAVAMLLISTGLVALSAEFLVDAIPEMTKNSPISQAFIGLIILPIVGNAAEHVTAVTAAMHNKMDLAIGVAVGSSIQIALFVTPAVVLLGWALGKEMTLFFNIFETISLFVTTFVVNFLILDGRSNYMEGALLMSAYVIIAVCAFFYPDPIKESEIGGAVAGLT